MATCGRTILIHLPVVINNSDIYFVAMGVKGKLSAFASNLSNSITGLFTAPAGEGIESQKDLIYEYGQALIHIPQLLQRLAFRTRTLEAELQEVSSPGRLPLRTMLHALPA